MKGFGDLRKNFTNRKEYWQVPIVNYRLNPALITKFFVILAG